MLIFPSLMYQDRVARLLTIISSDIGTYIQRGNVREKNYTLLVEKNTDVK